MPNYVALKNELNTDPKGLGYAALLAKGADTDLANLLNATTGNGAGQVSQGIVSRNTFLHSILPAAGALRSGAITADVKSWWQDCVLRFVESADAIDTADAGVQGLLSQAVADGILTAAQQTAALTRTGSRAEVIGFFDQLGSSVQQVTDRDVAQALRS